MRCLPCNPEDIDELYAAMRAAVTAEGPVAVICRRKMCAGIPELEGKNDAHDVVSVKTASAYLERRGLGKAVEYLKRVQKSADPHGPYLGAGALGANRVVFGEAVVRCLQRMTLADRVAKV